MAKITLKGILGIAAGLGITGYAVKSMFKKDEVDECDNVVETEDYDEVEVEAVEDEAE